MAPGSRVCRGCPLDAPVPALPWLRALQRGGARGQTAPWRKLMPRKEKSRGGARSEGLQLFQRQLRVPAMLGRDRA